MQPKYFASPSVQELDAGGAIEPADQWRVLQLDNGVSYTDTLTDLQTDGIGKKRAWAVLQILPLRRLVSNRDAKFKWWLWLANIGPHGRAVLGNIAVALDLTQNSQTENHLRCTRTDGSTIEFVVTPKGVQPSVALLAAEEAMG